jgi:hypothetical protein
MDVQLNIFEGNAARDEGIQRAAIHAEAVNPGWNDQAYELLLKFLSVHVGPFMAEEVRSYAAMIDFPLPPHARAWGSVVVRAVKAGIIQRVGYEKVKNKNAHRTPATLWRQIKMAS